MWTALLGCASSPEYDPTAESNGYDEASLSRFEALQGLRQTNPDL
jgi:hypothetical protein